MTLALAAEHVTMWWITLGLGFVVIAVVVVLLTLLTSFVKDIDQAVSRIREEASGVAANTASTELLAATASAATRLRDEVGLHGTLLADLTGARS